jgi:hypothetical protein
MYPVTHFHNRRILILPTPIDFVEQSPFAVTINPVASDLLQLTPIFEQFMKQILALVAILIIAATVSARKSSFAFAMAGLGLFDQKKCRTPRPRPSQPPSKSELATEKTGS